jgi:signal peptidase
MDRPDAGDDETHGKDGPVDPDDEGPHSGPDEADATPRPEDGGVGNDDFDVSPPTEDRATAGPRDGPVAEGETGTRAGGTDGGVPDPGSGSEVAEAAVVGAEDGTESGVARAETGPREDDRAGEWQTFVRDIVSSAVAVLLVGGLIFAVSGVWPPMVAVESPSMTPNMQTGDLVFVMEEHRFSGEGAQGETGVVTARTGATTDVEHTKFGRQGDVIVYEPDGSTVKTPIIHRAMFWVEAGENWYDRADRQAVGRYSECGDTAEEALPNCPAPHGGFVTKGDANSAYDQARGLSEPVKPSWVVGTAELRVPKLGCIRLRTDGCFGLVTAPAGTASANATAGPGRAVSCRSGSERTAGCFRSPRGANPR